MTEVFTLTAPAARKIAEIRAGESVDGSPLRVAVRPGGCSGFSYEMFFDDETTPEDSSFSVETESGPVAVVVDKASAALLVGATLDYADTLQGSGFKFTNPNASRTCGCGQSFS